MSTEANHDQQRLFGLAAEFESPESILEAAQRVVGAGYRRVEAYTPFPVEGLPEAVGFHRTGIAPIVLGGGMTGASLGFLMQWYANTIGYPWNVGGRPPNSWPMFIPITFELGVLFAAFAGVIAMLALNGLPRPYHPMFRLEAFARASRDRFFLCVEADDPQFERERTGQLLLDLKPLAVMEVPR